MSIVAENLSGVDVHDMLQLRKKGGKEKKMTCFCICVRSGLAIDFFCRQ